MDANEPDQSGAHAAPEPEAGASGHRSEHHHGEHHHHGDHHHDDTHVPDAHRVGGGAENPLAARAPIEGEGETWEQPGPGAPGDSTRSWPRLAGPGEAGNHLEPRAGGTFHGHPSSTWSPGNPLQPVEPHVAPADGADPSDAASADPRRDATPEPPARER